MSERWIKERRQVKDRRRGQKVEELKLYHSMQKTSPELLQALGPIDKVEWRSHNIQKKHWGFIRIQIDRSHKMILDLLKIGILRNEGQLKRYRFII